MLDPIMVDALGTIAAAMVTGSAGYVAKKAQEMADDIHKLREFAEENRDMAQENRELIAGDPAAGQSLSDRLSDLENTVYQHPREGSK
jgi:methyl-accepting chemotaxis protein